MHDEMARPSSTNPLGKLTDRIDVPVPPELKERVAALAIVHGYGSSSEYVRELLMRHVYGELAHVQTYSRRRGPPMGGTSE